MSVILTGGQSFEQIAANYTLDPAYAPAIAIYNNMPDQNITGQKYRIEIPDTWMKPEYSGKQIDLMQGQSFGGVSPLVWGAIALGALLLVK